MAKPTPALPGYSCSGLQIGVTGVVLLLLLLIPMPEIRIGVGVLALAGVLGSLHFRRHCPPVTKLMAGLDHAKTRCRELEAELGRSTESNQVMGEELANERQLATQSAQQTNLKIERLDSLLAEQQKQSANLRETAAANDTRISKLQRALHEQLSRYQRLEHERAEDRQKAITQLTDANARIEELTATLSQREVQLEALQDQLSTKHELERANITLQEQVQSFSTQLASKHHLEKRVAEQLELIERQERAQRDLNSENRRLQILLDASLSVETSTSYKERARADELAIALQQLQEVHDRRTQELEDLVSRHAIEMQQILAEKDSEMVSLESHLVARIDDQARELAQAQDRLAELHGSLEAAQLESGSLRTEAEKLQALLASERGRLAEEFDQRCDTLRAELEQQLVDLSVARSREQARVADLELASNHDAQALLSAQERIRDLEAALETALRDSQPNLDPVFGPIAASETPSDSQPHEVNLDCVAALVDASTHKEQDSISTPSPENEAVVVPETTAELSCSADALPLPNSDLSLPMQELTEEVAPPIECGSESLERIHPQVDETTLESDSLLPSNKEQLHPDSSLLVPDLPESTTPAECPAQIPSVEPSLDSTQVPETDPCHSLDDSMPPLEQTHETTSTEAPKDVATQVSGESSTPSSELAPVLAHGTMNEAVEAATPAQDVSTETPAVSSESNYVDPLSSETVELVTT